MVHTKQQQQQQHKREKDLYTTQDTTYTQVLIYYVVSDVVMCRAVADGSCSSCLALPWHTYMLASYSAKMLCKMCDLLSLMQDLSVKKKKIRNA